MMLIAASWPSNRLAAVTNRTGWAGTCRADGVVAVMGLLTDEHRAAGATPIYVDFTGPYAENTWTSM